MMPSKNYNVNRLPWLLDEFFNTNWNTRRTENAPAMNIFEDDETFRIEIAAPGTGKEHFQVNLSHDGNLVIKMEKKSEDKQESEKNGKYLRREFAYNKYEQTLLIPENVDKNKIKANMADGVLTITLPKIKPEDQEKIERNIAIES